MNGESAVGVKDDWQDCSLVKPETDGESSCFLELGMDAFKPWRGHGSWSVAKLRRLWDLYCYRLLQVCMYAGAHQSMAFFC